MVLAGKPVYIGRWKSPESHANYDRVVAEWLAQGYCQRGSTTATAPERLANLYISEMILAFWRHAEKHYRHPDGTPTRELDNFRDALRPLRHLYGPTMKEMSKAAVAVYEKALDGPDEATTNEARME